MSRPIFDDPRNTTAWQQGRIIENVFFSDDEFHCRKKLVEARSTLFGRVQGDNGVILFYEDNSLTMDEFKIEQAELCFARASNAFGKVGLSKFSPYAQIKNRNVLDNGYDNVFSSLNGAGQYITGNFTQEMFNKLDSESKKELIRSHFIFKGIAQYHKDLSVNGLSYNNQQRNFPIQIGGIETTRNTGIRSIMRGDYVIWDVQDPGMPFNKYVGSAELSIPGNSTKKRLFVTEPLTAESISNFFKNILIAETHDEGVNLIFQNLNGDIPTELLSFKKKFENLLNGDLRKRYSSDVDGAAALRKDFNMFIGLFVDYFLDLQNRIIGRAITSAAPGRGFDILIGHGYSC